MTQAWSGRAVRHAIGKAEAGIGLKWVRHELDHPERKRPPEGGRFRLRLASSASHHAEQHQQNHKAERHAQQPQNDRHRSLPGPVMDRDGNARPTTEFRRRNGFRASGLPFRQFRRI
jgi:hypothetical protein